MLSNRFEDVLQSPDAAVHLASDDGTFPNNETLPVVVYEGAFVFGDRSHAALIESVFQANGWGGLWRNGIYSYHHYHSTAHEVLGVADGAARVQLGGDEGRTFEVEAGDVIVLPAGVAHKNIDATSGFLVVGAYPAGQQWDMNYGKPNERPQVDRNIEQVPLPSSDPVYGQEGPLAEYWHL